ncbi:MAG: hypothetical protein ACC655_11385, partial [Rhodothermia bacterium]
FCAAGYDSDFALECDVHDWMSLTAFRIEAGYSMLVLAKPVVCWSKRYKLPDTGARRRKRFSRFMHASTQESSYIDQVIR